MAKILVIDDEDIVRLLVRRILEKENIDVVEAEDGTNAIQLLENDPPDLILLDVMMPEPNGWEVCKKIKSDPRLREIPVIMFTVCRFREDVKESERSGANGHFTKPFEPEDLIEMIKNNLSPKEEV